MHMFTFHQRLPAYSKGSSMLFAEQRTTTPASPISDTEERECAWCLAERGVAPGTGSHGICPFHAAQIIEQSRKRRAERKQVGGHHE